MAAPERPEPDSGVVSEPEYAVIPNQGKHRLAALGVLAIWLCIDSASEGAASAFRSLRILTPQMLLIWIPDKLEFSSAFAKTLLSAIRIRQIGWVALAAVVGVLSVLMIARK